MKAITVFRFLLVMLLMSLLILLPVVLGPELQFGLGTNFISGASWLSLYKVLFNQLDYPVDYSGMAVAIIPVPPNEQSFLQSRQIQPVWGRYYKVPLVYNFNGSFWLATVIGLFYVFYRLSGNSADGEAD